MKKFLAISFLTLYLFSSTELHQLLKLPFLAEHFIEHKEQNKDITFWQYLCLHYAEKQVKDSDYEKDMKLPFKSHDCCGNSIVAYITEAIPVFLFKEKPVYSEAKSFTIYEEAFCISSFHSNIWQPPKAC